MEKFVKRLGDALHYWEIWKDEHELVTHYGIVGDVGEHEVRPLEKHENFVKIQNELASAAKGKGFGPILPHMYHDITINYLIDGFGNDADLERRHAMESVLDNALGWTGNGHCSGGEIGSGSMAVFCQVLDPDAALRTIKDNLTINGMIDGATIEHE